MSYARIGLTIGVLFAVLVAPLQADSLVVTTDDLSSPWRAIGPVGDLVGQPFDSVGVAWEASNVGWNSNPDYDDSNANGWVDPVTFLPLLIWPDGTGSDGSTPAYFRKEFVIPGQPSLGLLSFGVDDDVEIFINGFSVFKETDGLTTVLDNIDVTSRLHEGVNLVAAKAHDIQISEGLRITLNIVFQPVPEPSSIVLAVISGLAGLTFCLRRHRV